MIPGEALAGWLADADRQEAAVAATEAAKRTLAAAGGLKRLEREVEAAGSDAGAVLACARRFMESGLPGECMAVLIAAAARDSFFRSPLRIAASPVHTGLMLLDRPRLSLFLSVAAPDALAAKRIARTGRASIAFTGQRSVYRFLNSGGAILSFWEAPEIGSGFTAEASGRCRMVGRRAIADGEVMEMDGRRLSFVVEHATGDMVYLQAATPLDAAPLMVEYDSETLVFAGASSTDEAGSRTQLMLSLLRIMDRTDAAPLFAAMLESRHFNARWAAMREFLALDGEAALPHLRAMAQADPHPEVRAAAGQTLAAILPELQAEEPALCPA